MTADSLPHCFPSLSLLVVTLCRFLHVLFDKLLQLQVEEFTIQEIPKITEWELRAKPVSGNIRHMGELHCYKTRTGIDTEIN